MKTKTAEPPAEPPSAGPSATTHFWGNTAGVIEPGGDGTSIEVVVGDHLVTRRSDGFRRSFFPEASAEEWSDWRWQLRRRIRDLSELERIFVLTDDERSTVQRVGGRLPLGITPYYASLIDRTDSLDPLRRTMVPVAGELLRTRGEADDPLGEEEDSVEGGIVHRYRDRVLFLVTNFCATYCRYCTRARMVGHTGEFHASYQQFQAGIDYIASHPEIRDVLLSGGDPLTMTDDRLEWILERVRPIEHVEIIRIGSKVPVVAPQRITPDLVAMLRRYHPLWMSVHFVHPSEITPEVVQACARLADAGIPLGSQTVLLRGVNDDVDTMKQLVHGLLRARVRPYYLYQCDPISGSAHLRTSIDRGLEVLAGLRGHTTGYAVPTYVVDAPGGGGKIPLLPETLVGRDGDDVLLRNYEGAIHLYPDPRPGRARRRAHTP